MIGLKTLITGIMAVAAFGYITGAAAVEKDSVLVLAEDVGRCISGTTVEQDTGIGWPDDALAKSCKSKFSLDSMLKTMPVSKGSFY